MEPWVEPVIEWHARGDGDRHQALIATGEPLAQWPPAPTEQFPTDCLRIGREFWIWQPGVGGLRFADDAPQCIAYPAGHVDPSWFVHVVTRSWLPAVYQVWGRQVLHASAVARTDSGHVIAFAGRSGAGKSTIAYGVARRSGWCSISDDTLAFSVADAQIRLHPLQNNTRLRPASAEHFGAEAGLSPVPIAWPDRPLSFDRIYFLEGDDALDRPAELQPLRAADSYPLLLGQAHAFTLKLAEHNQRLMRDYLTLAAAVPIVRVRYRRGFDDLDRVIDAIEQDGAAVTPTS